MLKIYISGVVSPKSEWVYPTHLVLKSDNNYHYCDNYHALNGITKWSILNTKYQFIYLQTYTVFQKLKFSLSSDNITSRLCTDVTTTFGLKKIEAASISTFQNIC